MLQKCLLYTCMKKQHPYMIWLQANQRAMGLCSSCLQSFCKRHSRRFPSPLTPLLPVPSHIPSFFLHLSFLPVPLSPRICLSYLAAAAGCSLEPESLIPASPSPRWVQAKTKGLIGTLLPSSLRCRVHLQRREWPIEQESAGS